MARWNALKHGVLSETVVLPNEDKAQFQELLEQLREDLKPQGALEELLVERIATCFWRLRRVLRYDFGHYQGGGSSLVSAEKRLKQLTDIKQEVAQNGFTDDVKTRLFQIVSATPKPSNFTESALHSLLDQAISQVRSSTENEKREAGVLGLGRAVYNGSTDTLVRYETANERQLYRAIDQLERLQRQRAGDYVPPPAKLSVSTDI